MQLHDLFPAPGSRKNRKRVGRGNGSGHGSTAGRGDKGQNSRAGGGKGPGFEGGQNPLHMRMPKLPGFKNRFRTEYAIVNVSRLEEVFSAGDVVDVESLVQKGIVKSPTAPVAARAPDSRAARTRCTCACRSFRASLRAIAPSTQS